MSPLPTSPKYRWRVYLGEEEIEVCMATIATLAVKLIADAKAFVDTMSQAENKTQAWSQSVSKSMMKVGQDITSMGKGMTTYVTLPILAAGGAAIKMGSDLEETKNKVNVVFANMAEDVTAWSRTSDTAMGLSQQRALDAVSTFGAMGQSAGLNANENLKWSQSLVQLGSDWSSFYNLKPADSLNAIQSAVAGQYEPLRRMGIVINQASLEQKALQMGLMQEGGALSDAARYQALYALMVEKSSAAQGDFARTADGAANQARIVQAQYENAAAAIGTQLLPYATQLLGWVSKAITLFQQLSPEQQKWILILLAAAAVIGPLLIVVGSLVTAIGAMIPVITAVGGFLLPLAPYILAIALAIGLLYLAWTNNWGGIQEKTAAVIAFIKGIISGGLQFIQDLNSGKLGWISTMWKATWDTIKMYFETVWANIKLIFEAFSAAFHGDWRRFGEILREIWDNSWRMMGTILQTAWANFVQIISHLGDAIIKYFKNVDWGQVGLNILKGIGMGLLGGIPNLLETVKRVGSAVMDAFKGFFAIKSPSVKMEREVGWQLGAGQARGYERSVDALMPAVMTGPSNMSMPAMASAGAVGGGAITQVVVNIDHRPWISTADENEAKFALGPMLEQWLREYLKK